MWLSQTLSAVAVSLNDPQSCSYQLDVYNWLLNIFYSLLNGKAKKKGNIWMLIKVFLYRGVRDVSKLKRKRELCCGTYNLYTLFRIIDPTCLL